MAVIDVNPAHNNSRLELLRKYKAGLPFASGPYSSDINSIMSEANAYADQTGESPLKEADIQRMGEAAYLRRSNLYNYDPSAFRLSATPEMQNMFGANDEFRSRQLTLADALRERAAGNSPSVAQLQLQQGLEGSQRGLMSALASNRPGMSAGGAARSLARSYGQMAGQTNQNAALLRANEIMEAERSLGNVLGQGRGQDLNSRTQLLQAMMADMQGRQNLEASRARDLQNLYAMNPEAMVQFRKKKASIGQTLAKNAGVIGGIANQAAGAIGSISSMGGFGGAEVAPNQYQGNWDLANAKVIP